MQKSEDHVTVLLGTNSAAPVVKEVTAGEVAVEGVADPPPPGTNTAAFAALATERALAELWERNEKSMGGNPSDRTFNPTHGGAGLAGADGGA